MQAAIAMLIVTGFLALGGWSVWYSDRHPIHQNESKADSEDTVEQCHNHALRQASADRQQADIDRLAERVKRIERRLDTCAAEVGRRAPTER